VQKLVQVLSINKLVYTEITKKQKKAPQRSELNILSR